MRAMFSAAFLALLLYTVACGSGGSKSTPATVAMQAGNWSIIASSRQNTVTYYIGGNVDPSGGTANAQMHIVGSGCIDPTQPVAFTGQDAQGGLTLTSAAINNQVVTLQTTVSPDGTSLSGTFSVAGGCADGDSGALTGSVVSSISGNWTATEQLSNGTEIVTVTDNAAFTEASTATATGIFPLSGTLTFVNSPCSLSATIDPTSSYVAGNSVRFLTQTQDVDGETGLIFWQAYLLNPVAPTSFKASYSVISGYCAGNSSTVTLTLTPPTS